MKYLALVYYDEAIMNRMSQDDWDALNRECADGAARLAEQGHFINGTPLQPVATATSVRVRNGQTLVTDGPFAETKEQLAGFYLLEARDMNEAIRLAEKIPTARYGCIEVRPLRDLLPSNNTR